MITSTLLLRLKDVNIRVKVQSWLFGPQSFCNLMRDTDLHNIKDHKL